MKMTQRRQLGSSWRTSSTRGTSSFSAKISKPSGKLALPYRTPTRSLAMKTKLWTLKTARANLRTPATCAPRRSFAVTSCCPTTRKHATLIRFTSRCSCFPSSVKNLMNSAWMFPCLSLMKASSFTRRKHLKRLK